MNSLTRFSRVLLCMTLWLAATPMPAATLTWDGGSGTWNTTSALWNGSSVTWPTAGADVALFNGTAGTVTLSGSIAANGLTFDVAGYTVTGGTLTLTPSAPKITTNQSATLSSVIAGTEGFQKDGASTLTLSAANTYSGVTTFSTGTINVGSLSNYGANGSLGNRAVGGDGGGNVGLLFRGGSLQYTGSTAQTTNRAIRVGLEGATLDASGSLPEATMSFTATSSPNFFFNSGARTITFTGSNAGNNTFAMTIAQAGGTTNLVKSGPGTWVLSGANTYTGGTTITDGLLRLGNAGSLGGATGALALNGGRLDLNGYGITAGAVSITAAAATGNTIQSGTLTGSSYTVSNASGNVAISSVLAGSGGLDKSGSGVLTLAAANSYIGVTTLSSGTINVGSLSDYGANGSLGNRSSDSGGNVGILFRGGVLQYTGSTTQTTNRAIRVGLEGATLDASGSLPEATMSFTATSSPDFFFNGGNRTVTFTGSNTGDNTFAIAINQAGITSVIKTGSGTWKLSGTSNYSGGTTISAGRLALGSTSALGTGAVTFTGNATLRPDVTGTYSVPLTFNSGMTATIDAAVDVTLSGQTTGAGSLVKQNSGTLTLSGANAHSGGTTISAGRLVAASASALGASNVPVTMSGGQLDLGGGSRTVGTVSITSAPATGNTIESGTVTGSSYNVSNASGNVVISSVLAGSGGLSKSGAGALTLSAANTFSGTTRVDAGTLALDNASSLGASTFDTGGAGTLSVGGLTNATLGGLTGSGALVLTNTAGAGFALTVGANNQNTTYSGALTGVGGLTKTGTGTFTLSGGNTYSGTTSVSAGRLVAASSNALPGFGTAGRVVFGGGTLQVPVDGTAWTMAQVDTIVANATKTSGALALDIASGTQTQIGGYSGGIGLTKVGAGTLTLSASNPYTGPTIVSNGVLNVASGAAINAGGGIVTVADGAANAALSINGGAVTSAWPMYIGGANGTGAGVVTVNSGRLTASADIWIGSNASTANYGALVLNGGTVSAGSWLAVGRGSAYGPNPNTRGMLVVNGGALNTGNLSIGTIALSTTVSNLMVMAGGTVTVANNVLVGENLSGVLDMSGGSLTTGAAAGVRLKTAGAGTGILNLRGGTISTGFVNQGSSGTGTFNFNGGTLRATQTNATYMTGLASANVYGGGGTIDTNGFDITIAQPLLAATGTGVSTIAVSGGTGYLAAPIIEITGGGGTGATALATVDANGNLTGITVTNPGTGYTSNPTITLFGGGGSGATIGSIALAANVSGGLTKTGLGTLTLSGSNSYTGGTLVNAGTLKLGSNTALPTSSSLTLGTGSSAGVLAFGGNTATLRAITFNGSGSQLSEAGKLNLLATGTANATITVSSGSHALHPDTTLQSNTVIDTAAGSFFSLHGVIDGAKALTKLGSGTLSISGINSYSGGTYLNGGFVSVLNTGGLGSGTSTVTIDGNTVLNLNNTILSNPIVFGSGSGAIINSGTLVNVTGTYSITSGTGSSITTNYSVQSGGNIAFVSNLASTVYVQGTAVGTFSADVLQAGTVIVNAGGRGSFSGSLAGNATTSGSSAFSGSVLGTVTVAGGTATFSGATGASSAINVNSGLGVVTGTIGGIAHATTAAATLEINGRVLSTADVNAEAGSLVKLLGSQAFEGTTLENDGSVIVNRTANLALAAVMSGSGSLTKSDNLALTLTGNNTFTGLTTISGGTLSVGNGGTSGALAGNVLNNAALIFNRSDDSTYAGTVSGSGNLAKLGSGKLTLTGSSSYAGMTTVSNGALAVNGRIASSVDVAAGATLGGSGKIVGNIGGNGLIAPGNSPGILTVTGQLDATEITAFAFELSQTGAPAWNNATDSVNDVLRLTATSPFTTSLASTNAINVYLDVTSLANGDTFLGGFFVDNPNSTSNLLTTGLGSAVFNYFVKGDGNGLNPYNGTSYYTLAQFMATNTGITGVTQSVVSVASANFADGAITTGQVTQFVIVPEPGTAIVAGIGITMAAWSLRKRRRGSKVLR